MQNGRRTRVSRPGFSFLELQVAFVLLSIALAGLAPLVVMQSRQVKRLESRFNHQTTYHLTPSTNVWARKLGAAAMIETEDPGTIEAAGSAFEAHVNFQRPADPAPGTFDEADYEPDAGALFGDRGNGLTYGWNVDNSANAENRNSGSSPDERYDTLNHIQQDANEFTWEITVPSGTYYVRLVAGDADYINSVYQINVENVLTVDGVPTDGNRWLEGTATVTVTDGRLTVDSAPGASNSKICFIDIYPAYEVRILSVDRSPGSEEMTANVEVIGQ
ncbi:MAG: type II secretion system protein [Candidatus Nealsonbacteria bacterium]|nr:type II secretion system protein [Candidatus Nealsonbacteria bacterium]